MINSQSSTLNDQTANSVGVRAFPAGPADRLILVSYPLQGFETLVRDYSSETPLLVRLLFFNCD